MKSILKCQLAAFITNKKKRSTEAKKEYHGNTLLSYLFSLDNNVDSVDYDWNFFGKTPLHLFAGIGDTELVDLFLKTGANVDVEDHYKKTPLHFSAQNGHKKVVEILVKARANVGAEDLHKNTPLHLSAENGHTKVIKLLLIAGATVDAEGPKKKSPLHMCAKKGHKDVVEILLKAGSNVDVKDNDNKTPLHLSAEKGHKEVVKILLKAGANVDVKDIDKKTPLHLSAEKGHKDVVKILLKAGANVDSKATYSETPLVCSVFCGRKEVVEILLKAESKKQENSKRLSRFNKAQQFSLKHREKMSFLSDQIISTDYLDLITNSFDFPTRMMELERISANCPEIIPSTVVIDEVYTPVLGLSSSYTPLMSEKSHDLPQHLDKMRQQMGDCFSSECIYNEENPSCTDGIVIPTSVDFITKKSKIYNITPDNIRKDSFLTSGQVVVEQKNIPPDNDDSLTDDSSEASTQSHKLDVMNNIRKKIKDYWAKFSFEDGEDREMSCLPNKDNAFHDVKLVIPTTINVITKKKKIFYLSSSTQLNIGENNSVPLNSEIIVSSE